MRRIELACDFVFVVTLSVFILSVCCLISAASQVSQKESFYRAVDLFLAEAEKYAASLDGKSISEIEAAGKRAMLTWATIPTPTTLPNTIELRRVRVPVNALAKTIGMQVMDIATDGSINERQAHRIVSASLSASKASRR